MTGFLYLRFHFPISSWPEEQETGVIAWYYIDEHWGFTHVTEYFSRGCVWFDNVKHKLSNLILMECIEIQIFYSLKRGSVWASLKNYH